ncbi:hypothetical protein [Kitasatospora sp. NBC_00458]|uniref:hypothetical protein n=1 Tax=Kitasatospora sp. NBC_00458 TaxID=2903568 RepID=UPI002E170F8B
MHDLLLRLPDIAAVRDRCRALAMLDAVLSPDWEGRYYSFDAQWGEGEEMASMRDGCGDDWFMVFSSAGVYARGFAHESQNAPHLLTEVPEVFRSIVEEPAFAGHDGSPIVTVCFWRQTGDAHWRAPVAAATGGAELFGLLADGTAGAYREWAEEYYEPEHEPSLSAVEHVLALRPLTAEVVSALNPDTDLDELADDIAGIGYPV